MPNLLLGRSELFSPITSEQYLNRKTELLEREAIMEGKEVNSSERSFKAV